MPRSRTLALARHPEAVTLFRQGATFESIARRVGYANRGTAHRVVTAAYQHRIIEDIDFHRTMEVARLDSLQADLWDDLATDPRRKAPHHRHDPVDHQAADEDPRPVRPSAGPAQDVVDPSIGNTGKATSRVPDTRKGRGRGWHPGGCLGTSPSGMGSNTRCCLAARPGRTRGVSMLVGPGHRTRL